jgi:hypothetical protein
VACGQTTGPLLRLLLLLLLLSLLLLGVSCWWVGILWCIIARPNQALQVLGMLLACSQTSGPRLLLLQGLLLLLLLGLQLLLPGCLIASRQANRRAGGRSFLLLLLLLLQHAHPTACVPAVVYTSDSHFWLAGCACLC